MNYLNITKYIYLVVGIVMAVDAIYKWNDPDKPWLSVILSGLAFFTFFFRNKFAKKFDNYDKQNKSKQP